MTVEIKLTGRILAPEGKTMRASWFSPAFHRELELVFLASLSTNSDIHEFVPTERLSAKTVMLVYCHIQNNWYI